MEYYSAIKRNKTGSFVEIWIDLETVIQSEVSQKENNKYRILLLICAIYKNGTDELICQSVEQSEHTQHLLSSRPYMGMICGTPNN